MQNTKRRATVLGGALLLLLFSFLLSMRYGSTYLGTKEFFGAIFGHTGCENASLILRAIRLPRALAALLAGAGLALSGSLLQLVTDNALAAPNVLGINAGAGFFVILMLSIAPALYALLPLAAFLGALLTALLILLVSTRVDGSKSTTVLCGVALSALFSAGISFFSVLDADVLSAYNDFSVGGFRGVTLPRLYAPAAVIFLCILCALLLARRLQLFCLGDTLASSLGVRVKRIRILALVLAAASAAAAVSFAGLLGFVGLVLPHTARKIARHDVQLELMLSPIGGAILLLLADLAGRVLFSPTEVPVGIFTALLGVPFFLTLILRRKRHA